MNNDSDILSEIINNEKDDEVKNLEVDLTKQMNIFQQKKFEEKHWYFKYRIKALQRLLKGYIIGENCDILDIGVGTGTLSKYLEQFGKVTHIEQDINSIKFNNSLEITKGIFPWNMALPDKRFDYIVLLNLIEYNDNIKWILDVSKSLLKPNGKIILSTLSGKKLSKNDMMYKVKKRYSIEDLTNILNEINMKINYYTYFESLSLQEQLKENLNKWFDEEIIYWNELNENNDIIYDYLISKELPKLGISKINNGNQLFLIAENMSKEDMINRSIKISKNNKRVGLIDLAIDKFAKKIRKNEQ